MKVTIEVSDGLYRRVKAKSALEGRPVREVAEELFRGYVEAAAGPASDQQGDERLIDGEPAPPWFAVLRPYARRVKKHDMVAIRRSIARGVVREREP